MRSATLSYLSHAFMSFNEHTDTYYAIPETVLFRRPLPCLFACAKQDRRFVQTRCSQLTIADYRLVNQMPFADTISFVTLDELIHCWSLPLLSTRRSPL